VLLQCHGGVGLGQYAKGGHPQGSYRVQGAGSIQYRFLQVSCTGGLYAERLYRFQTILILTTHLHLHEDSHLQYPESLGQIQMAQVCAAVY